MYSAFYQINDDDDDDDIVVPYKLAKFEEDRFGNGGATTFFNFAWAL